MSPTGLLTLGRALHLSDSFPNPKTVEAQLQQSLFYATQTTATQRYGLVGKATG